MLSGIANFIFGSTSEDPACDKERVESNEDGFKTTHVDNEWLLVDRTGCDKENLPSHCAIAADCSTNIKFHVFDHVNHSCNSSPCHTGRRSPFGDRGVGLEESWLVTPPACFTAESPDSSMLTSHPMEDLLIEHPSMSVYGPRACGNGSVSSDQSTSSSTSSCSKVQPRTKTKSAVQRHPPRKPRAVAQCAGIIAQIETQRPAQKAQLRHSARLQSRNKLQRSNRVVQYNAKSRNLRRSEHGMKHSGKSNNRKC